MRKLTIHSLALTVLALFLTAASAQGAVYNFQLQGLNTAEESATGSVIAVTGDGIFDTIKDTVKATGSFTVYDSTGAVVSRGTWAATDFVSFDAGGGVNRGFQTGTLEIDITLRPRGAAAITGVLMTVHCDEDEVPGPSEPGNTDGTTVGPFTENAHGFTLFQLIHP